VQIHDSEFDVSSSLEFEEHFLCNFMLYFFPKISRYLVGIFYYVKKKTPKCLSPLPAVGVLYCTVLFVGIWRLG